MNNQIATPMALSNIIPSVGIKSAHVAGHGEILGRRTGGAASEKFRAAQRGVLSLIFAQKLTALFFNTAANAATPNPAVSAARPLEGPLYHD